MAAADKLLVVHTENRVVRVEEVGMEDDLDAVRHVVEELDAPDLVEDRVVGIVGHVVRCDGWERVAAEREDAALEHDLVFFGQEVFRRREVRVLAVHEGYMCAVSRFVEHAPVRSHSVVEQTGTDLVLDFCYSVSQLFRHCLALESVYRIRVRCGRHDNERDDGCL